MVGHKNLTLAIQGLHTAKACLFSHDASHEASIISVVVRQHFSKIRDIKKYAHLREVVLARAPLGGGGAWKTMPPCDVRGVG